jgi:hypothetical protein
VSRVALERAVAEMEAGLAAITDEQLAAVTPAYQHLVRRMRAATEEYRRAEREARCDTCQRPITGENCCSCGLASPR